MLLRQRKGFKTAKRAQTPVSKRSAPGKPCPEEPFTHGYPICAAGLHERQKELEKLLDKKERGITEWQAG